MARSAPLNAAARGRRAIAAAALERSGLGALLRLAPGWRGLVVLNYHRIGTPGDSPLDRAMWNATLEDFDAQVGFLARNFDVIGPADVTARPRGRQVLITFDDGYRDNHAAALPILQAHGARATFFLATGFLDAPRLAWWDEVAWMIRTSARDSICVDGAGVAFDDPDRAAAVATLLDRAKALPGAELGGLPDRVGVATGTGRAPALVRTAQWMTWRMARDLLAAGMTVGGHTVSHPILARLDPDAQRAEIRGCARAAARRARDPDALVQLPQRRPGLVRRAHARAARGGRGRARVQLRRRLPAARRAVGPLRRPAHRRRAADRGRRVRRDRDPAARVHPIDGREPGMTARTARLALGALACGAALGGCMSSEASFEPLTATKPKAQSRQPARVYVDKDSIGGPCNDSRPVAAAQAPTTPWCSLGRAVDSAPSGSTILVRRGSYPRLTIQGERRTRFVTIRSAPRETATLNGFTATNSSYWRFQGLRFAGASNLIFFGNDHIDMIGNDLRVSPRSARAATSASSTTASTTCRAHRASRSTASGSGS